MYEVKCNLHIHSQYSDGTGNFKTIAEEALLAGVDVIILTDHNVLVNGVEQFYEKNGKRLLLLTGEEVHDQSRMPQKNHMLVIGAGTEMAQYAAEPQELINQVHQHGGLSFLAHPFENDLPQFNETAITWEDWDVSGFTGLEIWNGFSELKTVARTMNQVIYYGFFPELIPHQPAPLALVRWDQLLAAGEKVVAVAGSDAHALDFHFGPFHKVIFPYRYHFSSINNHLLLPEPLSGNLEKDSQAVYRALEQGSNFICLDSAGNSAGFSFRAENDETSVTMGGQLTLNPGATIRISLPDKADVRLIHNGVLLEEVQETTHLVKTIDKPGAYRVEAYRHYLNKSRGWIFSNPIYVEKKPKVPIGHFFTGDEAAAASLI